jgi:hypothetical protein
MNIQAALQKLGFRQRAYQATFGEGTPGHLVMVDLAIQSRAFMADLDGLTDGQIREMYGKRQMFFYIASHLKLAPTEIETVYRSSVMRTAMRLQTVHGGEE